MLCIEEFRTVETLAYCIRVKFPCLEFPPEHGLGPSLYDKSQKSADEDYLLEIGAPLLTIKLFLQHDT